MDNALALDDSDDTLNTSAWGESIRAPLRELPRMSSLSSLRGEDYCSSGGKCGQTATTCAVAGSATAAEDIERWPPCHSRDRQEKFWLRKPDPKKGARR
jgi:hypothetical protein